MMEIKIMDDTAEMLKKKLDRETKKAISDNIPSTDDMFSDSIKKYITRQVNASVRATVKEYLDLVPLEQNDPMDN